MKSLIKNTIIRQAIELGFDFEQFTNDTDLQEVNQTLIDFFNENSGKLPRLEDECEVTNNGRTQHVCYVDFWSDGEIIDFSNHWSKSPDTKIFHSDFVMEDNDGLMKNMHLYYLVGETEYNCPDGTHYDPKEKTHILDTYNIMFNDSEHSNDKGFALDYESAFAYILRYNGTNESYFEDYKGGTVSIVNNYTGETVHSEIII